MTITQLPTESPTTVWERPAEPVPQLAPPSAEEVTTPEARLGRAFLRGTVIGTVLVFSFCAGVSFAAGLALWPAVGIGAFTAFWGGPGFGGMLGATLYYSGHAAEFSPPAIAPPVRDR